MKHSSEREEKEKDKSSFDGYRRRSFHLFKMRRPHRSFRQFVITRTYSTIINPGWFLSPSLDIVTVEHFHVSSSQERILLIPSFIMSSSSSHHQEAIACSSPTSERPPANLDSLPNEILACIFEFCLPDCIQALGRRGSKVCSAGLAFTLSSTSRAAAYQPIRSLCLTSRRYRKLAQPLLYRAVMALGTHGSSKCYEISSGRPDLWGKVVYVSFRLRHKDCVPELVWRLNTVLRRTQGVRSLCLRVDDEPDPENTGRLAAEPVVFMQFLIDRLPTHITLLHLVCQDPSQWLAYWEAFINILPHSSTKRLVWSHFSDSTANCLSWAIVEQRSWEQNNDSTTKALQLGNLTEIQLKFASVIEVSGLVIPTELDVWVPDTESAEYHAYLGRLVVRASERARCLRLQCSRTRKEQRFQQLALGIPVIERSQFLHLNSLTISLQLLVGDEWIEESAGALGLPSVVHIGYGPQGTYCGNARLLEPGWMTFCFPQLQEFRLVEYFRYLADWDHMCGKSTGFAAGLEAASRPVCLHNAMVAELLRRFCTVWESHEAGRKVLFKKFKFSTAGWRIIQTLGRMSLFLVLVQPGDVGFAREDEGFMRVHSEVAAR